MLEEKQRELLRAAYKYFSITKDYVLIEDAINVVMESCPEKFFQGPKDKALEQRVFVHAPRSPYWSGSARTYADAYPVGK